MSSERSRCLAVPGVSKGGQCRAEQRGLFKRSRKGRRQHSAACVRAAAAPESGAGATFRALVTVLAMWAIHRADSKLPRGFEINLCGINVLHWMLTGTRSVQIDKAGGTEASKTRTGGRH